MQKFIGIVGIVALVGLVGFALMKTGSPKQARLLKEDSATIKLMNCMGCYAEQHRCNKKHLPADNAALRSYAAAGSDYCSAINFSCNREVLGVGDAIFAGNTYKKTTKGYELCGHLNADSKTQSARGEKNYYGNRNPLFREYPAGEHCFAVHSTSCVKKRY